MPRRLNSSLLETGSLLRARCSVPSRAQVEMMELFDGAAFGSVFDSSGEALLVIDRRGRLRRTNRRAQEMLRINHDGHERGSLADLLMAPGDIELIAWCSETDPSVHTHRPLKPSCINGLLPNGFPVRITMRTVLPGSDDLLICLEESSALQRVEERSDQLEAELSSLLDALEAGVILVDPSGKV